MIHQFRDKKQIDQKKKVIKNIIFLIIFLLLGVGGVYSFTGGFFNYIGRPIWKIRNSTSDNLESTSYLFKTRASIFSENNNLLLENTRLRTSMIDYNILKEENLKLKELFDRVPPGKNLILANILTKPNYSLYDTVIIDIGTDDGLSVGQKVFSNEVTPIGKISIVYKDTSLVTLYTNPGEVTEVMIDGFNTNLELIGRGGGNFEMTIPIDLPFTNNTLVFLPNIESEIIAIIKDVISSPNDPVKKVLLISPINVQNLKWVFVNRN